MIHEAVDWIRHQARSRQQSAAQSMGRRGEDLAHRFLEQSGYRVVARNYRLPDNSGEVDLVARQGDLLVAVEVKSRATDEFGSPDRAVGTDKQRHIARAALDFARRAGVSRQNIRFDIVSIIFTRPPAITHQEDVFRIPV
jgi:putative endonuclease